MVLKQNWANGDQFQASDLNSVAAQVNANYTKPSTGIPATDLAGAVQTSLSKADSAVQSVSSTSITDATTTGRGILTAANASTARTALGVAYGNVAGTVCEGSDSRLSPSSTSITDATTIGKALLVATDAPTARAALGVDYGTATGTVIQGAGALGTPSSGTLTNCTGLPITGLVASTSVALSTGTIELGHASDTTLSRSAAGVLAVEGVNVCLAGGAGQVADVSIVGFGAATARAVGTGDFPFGIKLQRAITFTSVTFRVATADASGNLVVELRKNGTQVSGTPTTIAAASQVAGGTSTGTWAFAAGDIITVQVTAVGTTPGKGLIADIKGLTT